MHTHTPLHSISSSVDNPNHPQIHSANSNTWEEYSSFHDSFAEQLAYENSRRHHSDSWHLNYI